MGMKNMSIGENVKIYREKSGMTLEQLAQKLGISLLDCEGIECGRRILSSAEIQKICSVLDVSLENLLTQPPTDSTAEEGSILMPVDELQNLLGKMKES